MHFSLLKCPKESYEFISASPVLTVGKQWNRLSSLTLRSPIHTLVEGKFWIPSSCMLKKLPMCLLHSVCEERVRLLYTFTEQDIAQNLVGLNWMINYQEYLCLGKYVIQNHFTGKKNSFSVNRVLYLRKPFQISSFNNFCSYLWFWSSKGLPKNLSFISCCLLKNGFNPLLGILTKDPGLKDAFTFSEISFEMFPCLTKKKLLFFILLELTSIFKNILYLSISWPVCLSDRQAKR